MAKLVISHITFDRDQVDPCEARVLELVNQLANENYSTADIGRHLLGVGCTLASTELGPERAAKMLQESYVPALREGKFETYFTEVVKN